VGESCFGENVLLEPTPTTSGAFEVIVNGKTLHSKLNGEGYVNEEKLIKIADFLKN
jgi:selT/selW/selH-like putative selenoprotein